MELTTLPQHPKSTRQMEVVGVDQVMEVAAVLILTIPNQVIRCSTYLSTSPFLNILAVHNSTIPIPTYLL